MSSPAKRQKLNKDAAPSSKPARNLDHFFGKQSAKPNSDIRNAPLIADVTSTNGHASTDGLTDEELARRLQEEWNNEDLTNGSTPHATPRGEPEGASTKRQEDTQIDGRSRSLEAAADDEEPSSAEPQEDVPTSGSKHTLSLQSATASEDTTTPNLPLDQSPLAFDPSQYVPDLKKQWAQEGGGSTYALLARCFVLVNSTQSRIKIVDTLVNLLRIIIEADQESLLPAVWLATNSIAPPYISLELGLGGSAISKALKKVCGLDAAALKTLYNKYGDAGDVAFEAKKRQSLTLRKPKPLSIKSVFESLVKIANSRGTGSQEVKQRIVERLVQDARGAEESRYIVRTLVQHLRIGAVKTTMLIALSRAFLLSRPPEASFATRDYRALVKLKKDQLAEIWSPAEEVVKACYSRHPNYGDLVPALLEVGICDELLVRCGLGLHIPLRPMLGNITRDLGDMLTKLHGREFGCEFKYDGQRAQVHCDDRGQVTIFSRHLEVMTDKYPDLVALVPNIRGEGVSSFILEGEVVAVDKETGDLRPFQTLANRARKDVAIHEVKVEVCLFAFDLMFLNGEELLNRPFRERRELLTSMFTKIPRRFTCVKSIDATSADFEAVQDFFKQALEIKCEGIMVKVLDNIANPELQTMTEDQDEAEQDRPLTSTPSKSKKGAKAQKTEDKEKGKGGRRKALLATYEPDKRVDSWLKVKKDYDTTADTLDLIPVGAWHGTGRKAKWWSPILLAVRNPGTGCLEAVTKCISGFTDKFYQANKEKYAEGSDNVISRPSYIEYAGRPDVWFEPQEVWEMAFADITVSPTYTAAIGLVHEDKGLSTRFPRFLKVREDKSIDEATTADYLATLFRRQESKAPKNGEGRGEIEEDD